MFCSFLKQIQLVFEKMESISSQTRHNSIHRKIADTKKFVGAVSSRGPGFITGYTITWNKEEVKSYQRYRR